jgi:hypothetical protein
MSNNNTAIKSRNMRGVWHGSNAESAHNYDGKTENGENFQQLSVCDRTILKFLKSSNNCVTILLYQPVTFALSGYGFSTLLGVNSDYFLKKH